MHESEHLMNAPSAFSASAQELLIKPLKFPFQLCSLSKSEVPQFQHCVADSTGKEEGSYDVASLPGSATQMPWNEGDYLVHHRY